MNLIKTMSAFALTVLLSAGASAQSFTVVFNGGEKVVFNNATFESLIFEDGHVLTPNDTLPHNSASLPDALEAIDLGLDSGTLWANLNLGAESVDGIGLYLAWGEKAVKDTYSWSTYSYCNGSASSLTKYNSYSSYGAVDNLTTLDALDDAATVLWGEEWTMPTYDQIEELVYSCEWVATTEGETAGYRVTGPNGNSIFLPLGGYYDNDTLEGLGANGHYWSKDNYFMCYNAYQILMSSSMGGYIWNSARYQGANIRPVKK